MKNPQRTSALLEVPAQDVICFDSFLDQKMFDKVIVQVSLSVVVMIF